MANKKRVFSTLSILAFLGFLLFLAFPFTAVSTTTTPALYATNVPAADSTANNVTADVVGNKTDAAAAGAVSTTESLMAYAKQNVTAAITNDANAEHSISYELSGITNGNNNLFTVSGGPIKILEIVAYVTTEIEGKSCLINYNIDPTTPATDTAFATDGTALEINADAVGTLYTWDGVLANDLTATTNGVALGNAALSGLVVPAGSIELAAVVATSATGAITIYMRYIPLSTSSVVAAAS